MTEFGLPLAGLRVLDISSFIAAPAAAVVLGDWGADVIKIEGPDGDANRRIMHDSSNYPKGEVNYPWQMDSRNKRSLVLDLKQPAARAALDRLIATSDVLVCNFPPPVRDKLNLTYDDVKKVNPRLIYASLTGYGESGPDRDRPGFDVTAYFARSGLLDAQRYKAARPACRSRARRPGDGDDLVSAILMALIHRIKTGEGSWVGTSLLGNGLWSCGVGAQAALVGAYLPHRPPPDRPRSALGPLPHFGRPLAAAHHRARGQDVAGHLRDHRTARAVGRSALATVEERRKRSGELAAILGAAFASRDYEHWRKTMSAHGITFGVISRPQDVPDDEQAVACGAVVDTAIPEMPRTSLIPSAWASPSSRSPDRRRRSASTATRFWPRRPMRDDFARHRPASARISSPCWPSAGAGGRAAARRSPGGSDWRACAASRGWRCRRPRRRPPPARRPARPAAG